MATLQTPLPRSTSVYDVNRYGYKPPRSPSPASTTTSYSPRSHNPITGSPVSNRIDRVYKKVIAQRPLCRKPLEEDFVFMTEMIEAGSTTPADPSFVKRVLFFSTDTSYRLIFLVQTRGMFRRGLRGLDLSDLQKAKLAQAKSYQILARQHDDFQERINEVSAIVDFLKGCSNQASSSMAAVELQMHYIEEQEKHLEVRIVPSLLSLSH